MTPSPRPRCDSLAFKVALALALSRFSKIHRPSPSFSPSDAQRWKQKAKDRKQEILRIREELKQLEDVMQCEADPPIASCRCHFFHGIGELEGSSVGHRDDRLWIDEVLRRRFLRLVRWKDRRKKVDRPLDRKEFLAFDSQNEIELLSTSINFLVGLTDTIFVKGEIGPSFAMLSHQATDFISAFCGFHLAEILQKLQVHVTVDIHQLLYNTKGNCGLSYGTGPICIDGDNVGSRSQSVANQLYSVVLFNMNQYLNFFRKFWKEDIELVEDVVNGLIAQLLRRMCRIVETNVPGSLDPASDPQLCVQHLIRKLGIEPFIGQRILVSISQKTSLMIESLLFMDPFDASFPCIHESMFLMIELMEFLLSDYIGSWISTAEFDTRLLEESVRSIIQTHKASELLESRIWLYTLYMERVIGQLPMILSPLARQGKFDLDILSHIIS